MKNIIKLAFAAMLLLTIGCAQLKVAPENPRLIDPEGSTYADARSPERGIKIADGKFFLQSRTYFAIG